MYFTIQSPFRNQSGRAHSNRCSPTASRSPAGSMQSRQKRYFAGRAPNVEDVSDGDSDSSDSNSGKIPTRTISTDRTVSNFGAPTLNQAATVASAPEKSARRRPRIQAKVVSTDETAVPTRERTKASKLTAFIPAKDDESSLNKEWVTGQESSSGESSSSYDSESESTSEVEMDAPRDTQQPRSPTPPRVLPPLVPIFIPRAARVGIGRATAKGSEEDGEDAAGRRREAQEAREREAREKLLSRARERDETDHDLQRVDMAMFPDDTDRPEDKETEFALWRVRELKRIMRERGMDVDGTTRSEEEFAGTQEKSNDGMNNGDGKKEGEAGEKSGAGRTRYKVGAFFAEKGPDGRYVEAVYNRDYGEQTESARRKQVIRPMEATVIGTQCKTVFRP